MFPHLNDVDNSSSGYWCTKMIDKDGTQRWQRWRWELATTWKSRRRSRGMEFRHCCCGIQDERMSRLEDLWPRSTPNPVSRSVKVVLMGDSAHSHLPTSAQATSQPTEDGAVFVIYLALEAKRKWPTCQSDVWEITLWSSMVSTTLWWGHLGPVAQLTERSGSLWRKRAGEYPIFQASFSSNKVTNECMAIPSWYERGYFRPMGRSFRKCGEVDERKDGSPNCDSFGWLHIRWLQNVEMQAKTLALHLFL